MPSVCESCANNIEAGKNSMKCGGFCSALFCAKCCGLNDEIYAAVVNKSNLFWMCNTCKNLMDKARFRNALVSVEKANSELIAALKDQIRNDILQDIKEEIRTNFKTLIDSVPKTPLALAPSPFPLNSAKRKRDRDDIEHSTTRPTKLLRGTGICTSSTLSEPVSQADEKFWLYLSGISPEAPDASVTNLVIEKLGTNDVAVVKLIPRGKDPRTLNFVSYKIGLPLTLKDKAMDSGTWPIGIVYREFEDKTVNRRVFWKPTTASADLMITDVIPPVNP
ncbi:uncharacterized protein LOC128740050 [Sabethes cyaneus]|uniref:uncharacterized protein LOC128740050 n=1 Tax=Sabethes cyaneus TaxID=53552 RepID=UPI00237D74DF|nr:uncharacterized protein LOC128740050 [Sabethes cyaneus]